MLDYDGKTYTKFVYNDGDGSTGYDKSYALQFGSFDHVFHEEHIGVQPLPFAARTSTYTLINGRGYPDTVNPDRAALQRTTRALASDGERSATGSPSARWCETGRATADVAAAAVQPERRRLLFVTALGLPMRVVGQGARILRGGGEVGGKDLSYNTNVVTLGGGETTTC